jgi:hypothetical protein
MLSSCFVAKSHLDNFYFRCVILGKGACECFFLFGAMGHFCCCLDLAVSSYLFIYS